MIDFTVPCLLICTVAQCVYLQACTIQCMHPHKELTFLIPTQNLRICQGTFDFSCLLFLYFDLSDICTDEGLCLDTFMPLLYLLVFEIYEFITGQSVSVFGWCTYRETHERIRISFIWPSIFTHPMNLTPVLCYTLY